MKQGTHNHRPVSSTVKDDLDAGLRAHGIVLDDKHYHPLLNFLQVSPYVLQSSFAQPVTIQGWEEGNFPPDFNRASRKCGSWMKLSDEEARKIVEQFPVLQTIADTKGRFTDNPDLKDLPPDLSGKRRSEDSNPTHDRCTWTNCDAELQRKAERALKKLEDERMKIEQREQHAAHSEAKRKFTVAERWRIASKNRRCENNTYCYCETEVPKTKFHLLVGCKGRLQCPYRGWVHRKCARSEKDVRVPSTKEPDVDYWCNYCIMVAACGQDIFLPIK